MTLPALTRPDGLTPSPDETVRHQVAEATQRLRRYRRRCDRARLDRLRAQPELVEAIAALLRIPA